MLTISSSGISHAGQKSINEDNFYMNGIFIADDNAHTGSVYSDSKRRNIQFYAVFDGLGEEAQSSANPNIKFHDGQSSSFIAAHMLSKLQKHVINQRKSGKPYNLNDAVYKYVQKTNQQLFMNMQKKQVRSGASFAFLFIDGIKICAYNIGNCKVYALREGRLNLLTKNDTKVEELIYANQISPDIAHYTPENRILTQFLGYYPDEKPAVLNINNKLTLRAGDKFLLCSAGLCDAVSESRMLEIMLKDMSEQETIRELIREAEQSGARDNMTAVVVGAEVMDNATKVRKLRTKPSEAHFKPLPQSFRSRFNITPKMLKVGGVVAVCLTLLVVVAVFAVNGVLGIIDMLRPDGPAMQDDPPAVTMPVQPTAAATTEAVTTERTTLFNIPTHDPNAPTLPPYDPTADDPGELEPTVPPAPTTAPPPVVTEAPPQTEPPPTEPPVTEPQPDDDGPDIPTEPPPVTDPPVTDPPPTDPPATEPPPPTEPPDDYEPVVSPDPPPPIYD